MKHENMFPGPRMVSFFALTMRICLIRQVVVCKHKKVHEIYCNSCGKKIETTDNIKREDYLSIKKEWGYFSKKDGEIHSIFLCESCYDIWTKQFKLPVKVEKQTELL